MVMLMLSVSIVLWSMLEASVWWVAPDISISIAYVYFPHHWRRFVLLALIGACLGTILTYFWAQYAANDWLAYVTKMRFHSLQNVNYVQHSLAESNNSSIIKGAWGGIPYKLFIGLAAIQGISLTKITSLGLISRVLRFMFVLGVTMLIRNCCQPWSSKNKFTFAVILLCIWASMILLFDIWINKLFL